MRCIQLARRLSPADWGGTETVILETSRRLVRRGCETEILCTTATDPRRFEVIDGVPVRREPYFYPYIGLSEAAKHRLDRKGGSPFSLGILARLMTAPGVDLIHLHVGNRIGGIGRFAAVRRGIPYVVSVHGGMFDVPPEEVQSWTAPAESALEWGKVLGLMVGSRRVMQDAAAILCVGQREHELTQARFPETRVLHLPNGVDHERFASGDGAGFRRAHGVPEDAFVLLSVARIDPQKNQRLLLEALPRLLAIEPKAHVLLVGNPTDQDYLAQLRSLVRNNRLEPHVTIVPGLPGRSQSLVDAYHAADVFVLPSIHEPFGIVILEAWAAGLPVVASRLGGVANFVAHGSDALLFESARVTELCAAVESLIRSPELREALGTAGRQKAVSQYSWDRIADRLLEVYQEVIERHRARR